MEGLVIIVVLLLIGFGGIALSNGINSWGKNKYGENEWREINKAVQENDNRKKYNNYMFECPMCHSKNVKKISDLNRATSVAVWGVASDKIGKQYECDNCHHKW